MKIKNLTVSKLNNYIKTIFSNDPILSNVSVEGEISNFKNHSSGHLYFSLKDEYSRIQCIMFKSNAASLNFIPADGAEVVVKGYVNLYEKSGQYQLYAQEMSLKGEGNLYLKFEKLKDLLRDKGWFDERNKLPIPLYPKKIAVVTSETGAAIRDIVSVASRRNPSVKLYLHPVLVQGENAKYEIAETLKKINRDRDVDLIILARGGGSLEELWAFNEYVVAESIYNSQIPIITGIGHEIDFTIADFVSDLRAPTPSAAAEVAIPSIVEIKEKLDGYKSRLCKQVQNKLQVNKKLVENFKNHYNLKRPLDLIYQRKQQVYILENKVEKMLAGNLNDKRIQLLNLKTKLNQLNNSIINRGVIKNARGERINSVHNLKVEDELLIEFKDGNVFAKITEIDEVENEREII